MKRRLLLSLAPAALAAWRLAVRAPGDWWRDVPLILAGFLLWTLWRRKPDASVPVAAWLLGLYIAAQGPHVLQVLGLR